MATAAPAPKREWLPKWVHSLASICTVLALVLTLIAMMWSCNQSDTLEEISGALSTKYLGDFPDQIPAITRMIAPPDDGAKHTVDIMVDHVGYGQYSLPKQEDFLKYYSAFQQQPENVQVRMLIYSNDQAERDTKKQFPEELFDFEKRRQTFKIYFTERHTELTAPCKTWEEFDKKVQYKDFIGLLRQTQVTRYQIGLVGKRGGSAKQRNVEIRFINRELPFFLWMRDGKEAVFAFEKPGVDVTAVKNASDPVEALSQFGTNSVSFRTIDTKLLSTYEGIFERLWKENSPEENLKRGEQTEVLEPQSVKVCSN
jgi:hypothetical protein